MRAERFRWVGPLVLILVGCGDPFGFLGPVPDEPTEVELSDHRTAPLQEPSAFDLIATRRARVDLSVNWDFLFLITEEGEAQLQPFTFVTGRFSEAGLQQMSQSFEAVRVAPKTGYNTSSPTTIVEGDVLAAISRRDPALGGLRCRRFGKLEILEIDREAGVLRFQHLVNPNCEGIGLAPGEVGPS